MPPKKTRALEKLPADVRKHVAAVHVGGNLGLVERRLINVLLLNAYDYLSEDNRTHTIAVPLLMETMDWALSKNVDHLKDALEKLVSTPIVFDMLKNGQQKWAVMAPLSFAEISNGQCSYRYDQGLSQKLADPAMYAVININIQNQFDSAYALALYENCFRFHRVGSTGPIDLEVWRELLGAQASVYDEFKYLSQRVLRPAIKAVNDVSNITLEMTVIRAGRKVTALRFSVELKAQQSFADVPGEPDDEIRQTEAFALLSKCNIGSKLAIDMIRKDPEKALRVARDTLARDAKKQIKTSKAGYARASFENGDVIDVVDTAEEKKLPTQPATAKEDKQETVTRGAWGKLTDAEKEAVTVEFIEKTGAQTRIAGKHEFSNIKEKADWTGYRGKRAAEVIASREA